MGRIPMDICPAGLKFAIFQQDKTSVMNEETAMATIDLWSEAPKNRYAAERMGRATSSADRIDAHSGRRRVNAMLAGLFVAINLAVLGALAPSVGNTVTALLTLPNLSAPSN